MNVTLTADQQAHLGRNLNAPQALSTASTCASLEEVAVNDDRLAADELARLRLDLLDLHAQVNYLLRYLHEQRERYPDLDWPEFDPRFVTPRG